MRNIAIIANYAFVTRQYLRTPIFELLKNNPNNFITIYTPAKRLAGEFRFPNVRVRNFRFLFGLKKSDLIIIPEWETRLPRDILKKSKGWKIPTLFVQEGAGNPSAGFTTDIYPTRICAWGRAARQIYIERGIAPERITITGQPRFDWYFGLENPKLFSQQNKKVLLFATQLLKNRQFFSDSEEIIARQFQVLSEASKLMNLQLVCKLHPSDTQKRYAREGVMVLGDSGISKKNYIREYCNNGYDPNIPDMKRLGEIFLSSDVVTTFFSTTGLEAMILERPVIFFDTADYHKKFHISNVFINRCRFALATKKNEFFELLERYLDNPCADSQKRKEVIFDFAYKQDGQASQRVVDVIEELIR